MIDKLVSYIMHVWRVKKQFNFIDNSILAMDETAVWNDEMFNTTIGIFGVKDIPMKTTGHEKARVLVCSAAKPTR